MESKRPKLFRDLPPFPKEQLQDKYTGGDIVIQACADDEQVAFHAVRNLIRKGRNKITMKWSKSGFAAIGDRKETPRNLFGFKDGTANVTTEKEFDKVVWTDSKDWMKGGSYMASSSTDALWRLGIVPICRSRKTPLVAIRNQVLLLVRKMSLTK